MPRDHVVTSCMCVYAVCEARSVRVGQFWERERRGKLLAEAWYKNVKLQNVRYFWQPTFT